ncbi:MAG: acetyl-CoA carboxylase carboxyl transferase subunit alpha, partial [Spirochaetaceae bacterium]|nr:acetyl-CoA carboxylase carboxyl transferase subunit alpha [Spirochaetaceae bacterium]
MNTATLKKKLQEFRALAEASGLDAREELALLEKKILSNSRTEATWKRVELARHPERPYSLDY